MAYTLTYTYKTEDNGYEVSGYTGTPDSVIIPSTYNDGTHGESDVLAIGNYAFKNCNSLTNIEIPSSVTSIGGTGAFQNCTSLISIIIPNSVTSIGVGVFQGCTSLTSIEIPNSVTSIGALAFQECTSLTNVTIPNSVTSIGGSAFTDCSSLTSAIIGSGVTFIGDWMFRRCNSLISITIPNSVTAIGMGAFQSCTSLTSVIISNSVIEIEDMAFQKCQALTSLTIPSSVTSLGYQIVGGYTANSKVTIIMASATPCTIDADAFDTAVLNKIYVPKGSADTYKTTGNWVNFADYIEEKSNLWYDFYNYTIANKEYIENHSGGGGGEPAAYIKDAAVSGNTLTLTKKDNTTVAFTPDSYTKDEIDGALASKQNTLVSGTNIKTINGNSLLGSGNISAEPSAYIKNASAANGTLTLTKKDNSTIAFTPSAITYSTTEPTSDNTSGVLSIIVLDAEPATRYNGYLYIITED